MNIQKDILKKKLNLKTQNEFKHNFMLEITITNECNCNCEYCFEKKQNNYDKIKYENQILILLDRLCNDPNFYEKNNLSIVFWGGEPTINIEFIKQIIAHTYKYNFVSYFLYSNGTLIDKYKELINCINHLNIKERFKIQLSYDGLPIHIDKRGNNINAIYDVANLLKDNNIDFSFKATLTLDYINQLPKIWNSYLDLYNKFGNVVRYSPTIDTTCNEDDLSKRFDDWKKSLIEIAKLEYKFIIEHNFPLMSWFNNRHGICERQNAIHIHTDGGIYICHGCLYSKDSQCFKLSSLDKLLNNIIDINNVSLKPTKEINDNCINCSATYCAVCHLTLVDRKNIKNDWNRCLSNKKELCKYYKYFGLINNILNHIIVSK